MTSLTGNMSRQYSVRLRRPRVCVDRRVRLSCRNSLERLNHSSLCLTLLQKDPYNRVKGMSLSDIRAARRRSSWWQNGVVAAYVLAMALLPLTHHDIACHLKSSTHCTTCLVGSAADLASDETTLGSSTLDDAGRAGIEGSARPDSLSLPTPSGRAPPVA